MVLPLAAWTHVKTWISGTRGRFRDPRIEDDAEVTVLADRVRLRQVLVNLLSNAVKYNRPGARSASAGRSRRAVATSSLRTTGSG